MDYSSILNETIEFITHNEEQIIINIQTEINKNRIKNLNIKGFHSQIYKQQKLDYIIKYIRKNILDSLNLNIEVILIIETDEQYLKLINRIEREIK